MDKFTKSIMAVIAVALCVIAFKLCYPAKISPTFGDFQSLKDIQDDQQRIVERKKLMQSLPAVRVQGGEIDAQVSGYVGIQ